MQKIVINRCYGGFGISNAAKDLYTQLAGAPPKSVYKIPRDDPTLVQVVEQLGESANGCYASLLIVEVPDGVKWEIEEYDGIEWVSEAHRTWPDDAAEGE